MNLLPTLPAHLAELTRISTAAFKSDINVGSSGPGGPPGYDSADFHAEMLAGGHLFTFTEADTIVGGAMLFVDAGTPWHMYIGRIFIDPVHFRKGFGKKLMELIESLYPSVTTFTLDTPEWNTRTNSFYRSLGYTEISRENGEIRYQKRK